MREHITLREHEMQRLQVLEQVLGKRLSLRAASGLMRVSYRQVYAQFNDTRFVEMLEEREGLRIGRETVRRRLREAGIRPKRRRRPPKHRSRRPHGRFATRRSLTPPDGCGN